MDPKSDEGIFLGYSTNRRDYRVFNSRTKGENLTGEVEGKLNVPEDFLTSSFWS